jgi:hypothetical protein
MFNTTVERVSLNIMDFNKNPTGKLFQQKKEIAGGDRDDAVSDIKPA